MNKDKNKKQSAKKKVDWKRIISIPFILAVFVPMLVVTTLTSAEAKITTSVFYMLFGAFGVFEVLRSMKFHWATAAASSLSIVLFFLIPISNYTFISVDFNDYKLATHISNVDDNVWIAQLLKKALDWKGFLFLIIGALIPVIVQPDVVKKHFVTSTIMIIFVMIIAGVFVKALWTINTIAPMTILLLILSVAISDTFGYLGGKYFGHKIFNGAKLAPKISPKKTWAGFIIGFVATFITTTLMGLYLHSWESITFSETAGKTVHYSLAIWESVFMALVISFAAPLGDLLFSAIKRQHGVKDFSKLIPGHGGLFDRLDALAFVTFVTSMIYLTAV